MTTRTCLSRWPALALSGLLAACGAGGETTGTSGGGGGGGGGGGEPGNGGGAGGPGGTGNPLDVVLEFAVRNDANTPRTETILASVPFPRGGYANLERLVVSGHQTAWLPMQTWSDGSVKVAQAQFTDTLAAGETKTYRVARDEDALTGSFTTNTWVGQVGTNLQFGAEVRDTFSVPYRGFASGEGTVVQQSPLARTKRWRAYHRVHGTQTGIGRDYLASVFYATEFRDMPFVVVDWIVANDYLGADSIPAGNTDPNFRPLGCVDVKQARFLCRGMSGAQPYRPTEEQIGAAQTSTDGYTTFLVMQDTFLDDGQTRRYRFLLRFEPPTASAIDLNQWRATANAMLQQPIHPLATPDTWEDTGAAGLVGGPVPGPSDAASRAAGEYAGWAAGNHFGTFGSHGDLLVTGTTGTPRNHPLSPELAHAIQGRYPRLLTKLEQMAWSQAMRPYHLWGLSVGAEQQLLLWDGIPIYPGSRDLSHESLGRRALRNSDPYSAYRTANAGRPRAHGWEHFDHEHWSTDLLFDYWTISGDAWAKEELRQIGQSLKSVMRLRTYSTANMQAVRAEGWCMQGFAQVYQATQDASIKTYAMRRVNEIIDVQRQKNHPSKALAFQGNYQGTFFPMNHEFFMPWQHGALLYGFLGAYRSFNEPILLQIAEDVADTVAYAWVTNYQDPRLGLVAQGLRYYVPVSHNGTPVAANYWDSTANIGVRWGDSPLGGAHTFLTGSLHLLAAMTTSSTVRTKALLYGGRLLGNPPASERWNKWVYCVPSNYLP
jgi:hypothetical protein